MYYHRINPRRAAQGIVPLFTPTNTAVVGLFNNSTTHRLAVWGANQTPATATNSLGVYPLNGHLATLVGPGTIMWTNQGAIEGVLYKDDLATPGAVVGCVFASFAGGFTFDNVPLWILDPGWSLVQVADIAATAFSAGFFWEQLDALAFPPHLFAYDYMEPD